MAWELWRAELRCFSMRQMKARFIAAAALLLGAVPAHAFTKPDFNAAPPCRMYANCR